MELNLCVNGATGCTIVKSINSTEHADTHKTWLGLPQATTVRLLEHTFEEQSQVKELTIQELKCEEITTQRIVNL